MPTGIRPLRRLAGVIDFGLTHLDSRPYELAIARTYRAPETIAAYRRELARNGWPLSELEEAALGPVNQAFRVDMTAWQMDQGRRTGRYDLAMIERQLSRTGTAPPTIRATTAGRRSLHRGRARCCGIPAWPGAPLGRYVKAVLDAGALVAVDRRDRAVGAQLRVLRG